MPSSNSKYLQEMREQTAVCILERGKSATSVAEEMGIDMNTVCRWVRDYRRKHGMPTCAEGKGIKTRPSKDDMELRQKMCELEKQLKEKDKEIECHKKGVEEERISVEILKKSLHIFIQPHEKNEAIEANGSIFKVEKMCKALELKAPTIIGGKDNGIKGL